MSAKMVPITVNSCASMELRSLVISAVANLAIPLSEIDSATTLTNVICLTTVVCMVALTCLELILVIANLAGLNAANICELLPCPLTPWVKTASDDDDSTTTLYEELPLFIKSIVTLQSNYNTSQIPGWDCPLCLSTKESTRTINHTAWNGSPQCAADRSALRDLQTCHYPCTNELVFDPLDAVTYVMDELTYAEWMEKAMNPILGNTALFFEREAVTDGDAYDLPYFYVVVANCDATKLSQTAAALTGVISDILPQFASKNKITVEIVDSATKYCAIKVSFDPLVESLSDCADSLYSETNSPPVQV